jgi:hypothetical protein
MRLPVSVQKNPGNSLGPLETQLVQAFSELDYQ